MALIAAVVAVQRDAALYVLSHGRAVQVHPFKSTLKVPGTKRLNLKYTGSPYESHVKSAGNVESAGNEVLESCI
jgi:hypothetical protein